MPLYRILCTGEVVWSIQVGPSPTDLESMDYVGPESADIMGPPVHTLQVVLWYPLRCLKALTALFPSFSYNSHHWENKISIQTGVQMLVIVNVFIRCRIKLFVMLHGSQWPDNMMHSKNSVE